MEIEYTEGGKVVLLTEAEHKRVHAENMTDEQREARRAMLMEKAIPKAAEWHRSEEGREWHRKHGRETWNERTPTEYRCTNCGRTFETMNAYPETGNRFCSNRCKSAHRRRMGYDNEQRSCEICGAEFTANKYGTRKRCDECRYIRRPIRRD